eukprot:gene8061-9916_t
MVTSDPLESDVGLFLVQCLLIIILSRIMSWLFAKIQQPSVIAEIISGILLGPTALGKIPGFTKELFNPESVKILSVFSQIGLIFFMFIIGLELDPKLFKSQIKQAAIISFFSIVFPFGLGLAASVYLASIQDTDWTYSLGIFIGVALCITAFPVLARILAAKKLLSTPIGILTIACAAINDICGWVLLGLSVSLAGSKNSLDSLWTLLASAGFVLVMIVIIRPLLEKAVSYVWHVDPNAAHPPSPSHIVMSGMVILLFAASWCTEFIGIHAMFGAFTLGAITPKVGAFNQAITEKIEDLILVFLLPLYFVVSGLRTDLTTLTSGESWIGVLIIISAACIGKIVGSGVPAKFLGCSTRDAISVGILMNTRGLVELIVLNLGLDFGIITTQVFGIMVLMAVFTTVLTSPLISLVTKKDKKVGGNGEFTVVLCTPSLAIGPSLIDLGYTICNKVSIHALTRRKLKKVYLLSMAEVNDRPSDFIGQIRKDMSKSNVQHLVQQGTTMKMKVSFNHIVSDSDHLSNDVIKYTESKGASLLVIAEDSNTMHLGRGGMISNEIIWSLIKNSTSHVGVFTDKSGTRGSYNRFRRILLAYLGGKNTNDEEALKLVNRMAETDGVLVTIIVFDNDIYWKHKKDQEIGLATKFLQPPINTSQQQQSLQQSQTLEKEKSLNNSQGVPPPPQTLDQQPSVVGENNNNNNVNISNNNGIPPSIQSSGGVSSLSKTTELYDPVQLAQYEVNLDAVVRGKNAKSINVIYKPKKSKQKVLLQECSNFDLLVLPYDPAKPATTAPFPSFHVPGIEMMKKSFSMVYLPGHGRRQSEKEIHLDEIVEELHQHDNYDHSSGGGSSSHNNNNNNNNIDSGIGSVKSGKENQPSINSSGEIDGDNNSLSSSNGDEYYWTKFPISTLVIYHKDTIPTSKKSKDEKEEDNGGDGGDKNHSSHENLEPYEVDPSDLRVVQPSNNPTDPIINKE